MKKQDFKINQITIAVSNMDEMIQFYSHVFHCEFLKKDIFGLTLHSTTIGGISFQFCPNDIAQVDAQQNRQQFHFSVDNLESLMQDIISSHGKIKDEILETEAGKSLSAIDPDGNTIVFIEKKQILNMRQV